MMCSVPTSYDLPPPYYDTNPDIQSPYLHTANILMQQQHHIDQKSALQAQDFELFDARLPHFASSTPSPNQLSHFRHPTQQQSPEASPSPSTSLTSHGGILPTATPPPGNPVNRTIPAENSSNPVNDDSDLRRTHHLSDTVILNVFYDGDAQTLVDEHFAKTLEDVKDGSDLKSTPLVARNFPISFWDPNYRPFPSSAPTSSSSSNSPTTSSSTAADLAAAAAAVAASSKPWNTDWHYPMSGSQYVNYSDCYQRLQTNTNYWNRLSLKTSLDWHSPVHFDAHLHQPSATSSPDSLQSYHTNLYGQQPHQSELQYQSYGYPGSYLQPHYGQQQIGFDGQQELLWSTSGF